MGLASTTGTVPTSYTYEPYGKTTASGTASASFLGFTGRENDSTGTLTLYNYRARAYSPTLHRFLTEDPIGFYGGDENLYRYVGDAPATARDPLGLSQPAVNQLIRFVVGPIAHAVDRAVGLIVLNALGLFGGGISMIFGADPRFCGNAICFDNANFFVPPWAKAWTLGHTIFCRDVCDPDLIKHELVHVDHQYATGISFVPRYIYQAAVNGIRCDNPWEAPAIEAGGGVCP